MPMIISQVGVVDQNALSISANGTTTPLTGFSGKQSIAIAIAITGLPAGGTPTLDVYVQTSFDGGTTWFDLAHTQFTATVATKLFNFALPADSFRRETFALQPVPPTSDAQLAGETILRNVVWGDQFRLKYVFAAGGSSGAYTLTSEIASN